MDLNHRRLCRQIYSLLPLATRAPTQGGHTLPERPRAAARHADGPTLPSAPCPVSTWCPRSTARRSATRSTRRSGSCPPASTSRTPNSTIEQNDLALTLRSSSEDRLRALRQVLEERLVKRGVSLKGLDYGKVEEAASSTVRQAATISVGISSDKAREINRMIKEKGPKGVSSQTQGDQVRVTGKKRDDLQAVIAAPQGGRPRHPPAVHQLQGLSLRRRPMRWRLLLASLGNASGIVAVRRPSRTHRVWPVAAAG